MTDINFRRKHIGGSDISKILGLTPATWGTTIDLANFHWGNNDGPEQNIFMKRGTALEPEAREAYMQFTGKLVSPVEDMEHLTHSFCSASLDGWTPSRDLIVEIKCPTSKVPLELAKEGKIASYYYVQVQWQLFVSGVKLAHFWVYHPENGHALIEIEENKEVQEIAFKAAQAYWEAVQSDQMPNANFMSQEIQDALKKVSIVELDAPINIKANDKDVEWWEKLDKEIAEKKEEIKQLEYEKKQTEIKLLDQTDGGKCILNGKIKVTPVEPKILIDWKKAREALEITDEQLKPFKKQSKPYTIFKLIVNN